MKRITGIFLLGAALASCSLAGKFRKSEFTYTEGTIEQSIPILIPKGYTSEKTEVDSSGNTILTYRYKDNSIFYIAHLADTSVQLQPFIESQNIPRVALQTGAWVFKGIDREDLFWREIRNQTIWTGYRFVPSETEARFDSATNYVA
ncbi:MAG TPA: hypothetical protein VHK91_14940, partial [Flavisolibacter sp.]|nr:hypothetical protein [Flavisolibacter sp.]